MSRGWDIENKEKMSWFLFWRRRGKAGFDKAVKGRFCGGILVLGRKEGKSWILESIIRFWQGESGKVKDREIWELGSR